MKILFIFILSRSDIMENLIKELKIFIEKKDINIERNVIEEILYDKNYNINSYRIVKEIQNKINYKSDVDCKIIYLSEYR